MTIVDNLDKKSLCTRSFSTHSWDIYIRGKIIANDLGPVVQSIVSLTSSLRVILLTVLADSIYNILIFFAEKTFFQQKNSAYLRITRCKF